MIEIVPYSEKSDRELIMNFKSILIVTYGRSGSTLLQGIVNSIEGCLIRGENNNFCFHLFQTYRAILKGKEKAANVVADYPTTAVNHPWYGAHLLDENLFFTGCQKLVKDLLLADDSQSYRLKCYGFKERYTYPEILEEFEDYLQFLTKIFPNIGFIFNTRNLDMVLESGWWQDRDYEQSKERLLATEHQFNRYLSRYPNTFHIRYEDVVGKTKNLKKMFDFLGVPYSEPEIDRVLSQQHSFNIKPGRVKGSISYL